MYNVACLGINLLGGRFGFQMSLIKPSMRITFEI